MRIGRANRPMVGERVSGDYIAVLERPGSLLCAVIDGLGHGPHAAIASHAAADFVSSNPDLPLDEMLRACDRAIALTRGVAMAVIRIDLAARKLEHAAVGNVELSALSVEAIRPIARVGLVGGRFRKAVTSAFRLHPGDLLVLFTDGISARLRLEPLRGAAPDTIARRVIELYGRNHDDASCLVIEV